MKKTIFLLHAVAFSLAEVLTQLRAKAGLALLFFVVPTQEGTAQQPANVTVQDDAKVGVIVTGTGNTINTTQIFGKSPEYAELKKRLDGLAASIAKKADACEQMAKDSLPAKYRDACRAELIALNAERDSVQKIETRFREDVIRLAETFSTIKLNSERLRLAKQLFDEGKIHEADNVLSAKEMQREGDALLARKERAQQTLQETDSLLLVKADEYAMKARLKVLDYADPLRYDSAQIYFEQSRRYAETIENLKDFANLLYSQNQSHRSIAYLEKAMQLAHSENDEALLARDLGHCYYTNQKMAEAEKMYLRSLEIRERLAASNPAQFEPGLAMTAMNLGIFYEAVQKMVESEKMYLRSLEIYERLAKSNPAQFEPDLANTAMNLGVFYYTNLKMVESEKMYLRSLEIYERLVKSNPAQFEPDLANTAMNLGLYYATVQKMAESEKMYLRSLEIYERLAKSNPAQFEPNLARTAMNFGNFYKAVQKMAESEKMYLRSLEIYERLAASNPAQFEPDLEKVLECLGIYFAAIHKNADAETMYLRAFEISERLAANNPAQFEPDLARTAMNLGLYYTTIQKMAESEKMNLRSLEIYERLARSNPAQFEPYLAFALNSFGHFRQVTGQFDEAKKMYSQALALRQKAVTSGQTYFFNELGLVYENMAALRDSFASRGDWADVVAIQQERAACVDSLISVETSLTKIASQDYGALSWYRLFARQYPEAQAAAERALSFDPSQNWIRTNLGHSYLLRGDWEKAKQAYEQYIANEKDQAVAKTTLLQDWNDLEKAGVTHPDMEKARKWLKE
ncbi:MAG: hypothetical protein EPGJADBJ_03323 [Saprospiraceae bacterium]|nr:hypothetical protein [Saprospiraceae bacterium]